MKRWWLPGLVSGFLLAVALVATALREHNNNDTLLGVGIGAMVFIAINAAFVLALPD